MENTLRYRIVAEWSDEDQVFVARVPALPGCAAHGPTPEKATKEARTAAEGILASMKAHGDAVPPEDATADFSGQLRLRLPKSLHEHVSRMADLEGVSINTLLLSYIAEGSGRRGVGKPLVRSKVSKGAKRKAVA